MLRQNNFEKFLNVKTWLALATNGRFQVISAIYKDNNGRKLYTYYDYRNSEYVTELA